MCDAQSSSRADGAGSDPGAPPERAAARSSASRRAKRRLLFSAIRVRVSVRSAPSPPAAIAPTGYRRSLAVSSNLAHGVTAGPMSGGARLRVPCEIPYRVRK